MPLTADYARYLGRELASARDQILAYPDERAIWALPPGLPNSGGTLALHMAGNLRWFIGAQLGNTGYVRDRDAEFNRRDVPRAELVAGIESAIDEVTRTLASLDPARLDETFPLEVGGVRLRTGLFIGHLAVHLGYHLGQLDYHRRIVTGVNKSLGAIPIAALAER